MGAIARAQIERFEDEILPEKIKVGEAFRLIFGENDIWSIQSIAKNTKSVFWLNSLKFKNLDRDQVRSVGAILENKGIECRSGFWPLSDMASYESTNFGLQEVGYDLFDKLLVLPSSWRLSETDLKFIHKETLAAVDLVS